MQMKLRETFDSGVDFGIKATKIATVLSMHKKGVDTDFIAEILELNKDEILEIINNPEDTLE